MSTVVGYGTDYDYDDDYIYYVLPQSVTYTVDISPDYIVNDWGTEEFLGTEIPCTAQMLYSQNLRDKLRTDVLTISTQTPALTTTEINRVSQNLGLTVHLTATLNAASVTVQSDQILESMRVVNATFGTPSALTSDVAWATANGSVTFTQTLASGSSTTIDCDLVVMNTIVAT